MEAWDIVVVGGGAAGFFAALAAAEALPGARIVILERGGEPLAKVRISGGGRCNVTNACFDPGELVRHYPRGGQELRGAFTRFHPGDMMTWLQRRGVTLKTEADGRVFPASDRAETIVECLLTEAQRTGIELRTHVAVQNIRRLEPGGFELACGDGSRLQAGRVLLAAGGAAKRAIQMAESLGHTILPPVPSLFTFEVRDARLQNLAGVSVRQAKLDLYPGAATDGRRGKPFSEQGAAPGYPLGAERAGCSAPVCLGRPLAGRLQLPGASAGELAAGPDPGRSLFLAGDLKAHSLAPAGPGAFRGRGAFLAPVEINRCCFGCAGRADLGGLSKAILRRLALELCQAEFRITGKGAFKEEFVTCGGVCLKEVDFRTMQSRLAPGVYFAGELLDIDGLTGGFNFQSAWTTAWIAGRAMATSLSS